MGSLNQVPLTAPLEAELARLANLDPTTLSDEQIRESLLGLLRSNNQIAAIVNGFVGSFDTRGLSETDGQRATRTWLIAYGHMSQGAATGHLKRARLVREMPALAEAAKQGAVSSEHLAKVTDLQTKVGIAAIKEYDQILADVASTATPVEVDKACERIRAYIDPDGPPPDPEAAFERRGIAIAPCGSMYAIRGQLDPEGAAVLKTAIDALMKPPGPDDLRTATQRRADALIELARLSLTNGQLPTVGGVRPQINILITPQALRNLHNSGDGHGADGPAPQPPSGSTASNSANPHGANPHGANPHGADPHWANPHDDGHPPDPDHAPPPSRRAPDPLSQVGVPPLPEPPWMNWIGEIPAELAQRISCDCEVWRTILDPATGLPLEVGRAHRIVPHWIRKALHARDRGCRWPGCESPTEWTDAHHLIAWYYGGVTNIDNLLLLCRYHHARVHEGHWRLTLDPATGHVYVHRPDGRPYELGPSQPFTGPHSRANNGLTRTDGPRPTRGPG